MAWVGAWVGLLPKFFVLCAEFLQDLLIADLAAGNAGEIIAGGFAEGHTFSGKSTADVTQVAVILCGLLLAHSEVIPSFSNLRQDCQFFPLAVVGRFTIAFCAVTKFVVAFFQCL